MGTHVDFGGEVGQCEISMVGDRILVRPDELQEVELTPGGIAIPGVSMEGLTRTIRGTVVAVGPGAHDDHGNRIPVEIEVGESVHVPSIVGSEVIIAGKVHKVIRERDCLLHYFRGV